MSRREESAQHIRCTLEPRELGLSHGDEHMKMILTSGAEDRYKRVLSPILEELGYGEQKKKYSTGGPILTQPIQEPLFPNLAVGALVSKDMSVREALEILDHLRRAADHGLLVLCFTEEGTALQAQLTTLGLTLPTRFRLLPFGSDQELRRRALLNIPVPNPHRQRTDYISDTDRCWFFDYTTPDYTGALAHFVQIILGHSKALEFRELRVRTIGPIVRISGWLHPAPGTPLYQWMIESIKRDLDIAFPTAAIIGMPQKEELAELLIEQSQNARRFNFQLRSRPGQVKEVATVCYEHAVPMVQVDVSPRRSTVDGSIINDIMLRVDMGAVAPQHQDAFLVAMNNTIARLSEEAAVDGEKANETADLNPQD